MLECPSVKCCLNFHNITKCNSFHFQRDQKCTERSAITATKSQLTRVKVEIPVSEETASEAGMGCS